MENNSYREASSATWKAGETTRGTGMNEPVCNFWLVNLENCLPIVLHYRIMAMFEIFLAGYLTMN
jgi:hypothetical protein